MAEPLSGRVDPAEFRRLELRCHDFLRDAPLHDVWAVPLAGGGPDRTVEDVRVLFEEVVSGSAGPWVRALFALRAVLGRVFRWDAAPAGAVARESYVNRLGPAERAASLVPPGTRRGSFRVVYALRNEELLEIRNATVHAFLVFAMIERATDPLLYLAIYVKPVGSITRFYMALIDPFRRFIIYPALLRAMQRAWARRYGKAGAAP